MGNPAIFSGRRTKLLTADGILNQNNSIIDNDGIKNYIANGHGELTVTTGWATYANAAGTSPVNGTGGAPSVTWTRTTTTPLAGQGSFLFTKGASNLQGNGASYDFTIDAKDKAKVINISADYIVSSGTFVAGSAGVASDLTVWIYDITNAIIIQPSSISFLSNSTTLSDRFNATFQTASNSTSYRLIVHVGTVSALAYTIMFDNVVASPSNYSYGSPVTDMITLNGVTATWTANTTTTAKYRRIGDHYQVEINSTLTGAPTSATLTYTLPFTMDTTKMTGSPATSFFLDGTTQSNRGATGTKLFPLYISSTTITISYLNSVATAAESVVNATAPVTWASGDQVTTKFMVPVAGLGSSVQMSEQTDTRVVAMTAYSQSGSGTLAASTNVVKFTTIASDTHGSYSTSTGLYTVPVSGWYRISGIIETNHASVAVGNILAATVQLNGVTNFSNVTKVGSTTNVRMTVAVSGSVFCKIGDTLGLYSFDNGTTPSYASFDTGSSLSIERLSGPNQIAATESLNGRYFSSSTTITGSLATILYTTKDWDTHGAYNTGTGIFTAPISGKYQFNASIAMTGTFILNSILDLQIQQTGSSSHIAETKAYAGGAVTQMNTNVGDIFYMIAGDTLKVQASNSGTTPVIAATTTQNWISWSRVGN